MDLTRRTVKNSIYSMLEFGWPIIIALFASPFIVHHLGPDAYGVLSIVGITLGVFGFLDLGMGGAAIRQFAERYERGDTDGFNRVLATVMAFYLIIGSVGALLIAVMTNPLVTRLLSIPKSLQSIASFAFYLSALGFMFALVNGMFGSIPKAIQRYDVATKLNVVLGTVNTLTTVGILYLGYGLREVTIGSLVVTVITLPAAFFIAKRLVPTLRVRPHLDVPLLKELSTFGGYFLLSSIGVTLLYQLDKLLIGSFLGVAAVTYYVVPGNLAQKIQGLIGAAAAVAFPVSSALLGTGQRDQLLKLYREGTRMAFILATAIAVPMAVFSHRFLTTWMGAEVAGHSSLVYVLLIATYYLLGVTSVPWNISFGSGRAQVNAIFTFGIAFADIAVFLLLIKPFGIVGAAAAYLLSAVVGVPVLISYIERKVIGLSGLEYVKIWWRIGLVGVLQGILAWLALPLAVNVYATLALMAASAVSFLGIYVLLGFWTEGDKRLLTMVVERFRTV